MSLGVWCPLKLDYKSFIESCAAMKDVRIRVSCSINYILPAGGVNSYSILITTVLFQTRYELLHFCLSFCYIDKLTVCPKNCEKGAVSDIISNLII